MRAQDYNVVYYWIPNTRKNGGQWHASTPLNSMDEVLTNLRVAGFVAHAGRRAIGPPEGPPSADELAQVEASKKYLGKGNR